jgi:hypothetical protein
MQSLAWCSRLAGLGRAAAAEMRGRSDLRLGVIISLSLDVPIDLVLVLQVERMRTYQDPVLAAAVLDAGLAPTTAQEFLPVKDGQRRRELVQDALREGWDAPQARATVKERCDSQQRSGYQATPADRCGSQQDMPISAERGARARSGVVVRRVQGLRAVLDAGPLAALSSEAVGNLRARSRLIWLNIFADG